MWMITILNSPQMSIMVAFVKLCYARQDVYCTTGVGTYKGILSKRDKNLSIMIQISVAEGRKQLQKTFFFVMWSCGQDLMKRQLMFGPIFVNLRPKSHFQAWTSVVMRALKAGWPTWSYSISQVFTKTIWTYISLNISTKTCYNKCLSIPKPYFPKRYYCKVSNSSSFFFNTWCLKVSKECYAAVRY